jgi:probable rRNA maturation factor
MISYNIGIENEFTQWNIEQDKILSAVKSIFDYYMSNTEISEKCCLREYQYDKISFDILFCDGEKTHLINREYRNKDYPADIITFAVFADSPNEERFVLDLEINLGEIIIALDKIEESAKEKSISKETELIFMVSHGIMHLLGFDHQTEKEFEFVVKWQKKALESIGIKYDKI